MIFVKIFTHFLFPLIVQTDLPIGVVPLGGAPRWWSVVVVEYHPISSQGFTPRQRLEKNADEYIRIIDKISENQEVLLYIFPEGTLDNAKTYHDLKDISVELNRGEIPCDKHRDNYPRFLVKLSCAAKSYKTNIFFNIIEEHMGTPYTSDVVITRDGSVFASFRREDRIGVKALRTSPIPFIVPVRFIFFFSEMLRYRLANRSASSPSSLVTGFRFSWEKVLSLREYRNYFISSNWISQLPFLTSLQVYQMWGQEFNVTLFFSGANDPKAGQGGTGIYHAETGPILMEIAPEAGTRTYIYNFSGSPAPGYLLTPVDDKDTDILAEEMDKFYLESDPDLYRYKSKILEEKKSQFHLVCYNGVNDNYFCCEFNVTLSINDDVPKNKNRYTYHLVAYRGYKTYYDIFEPGGAEVCALIACLDSTLLSCGRRFNNYRDIAWPLVFEKIVVKAKFGLARKEKIYFSSQFPNSLLSSIRPIHPNSTEWSKRDVKDFNNRSVYLERTFKLLRPQSRILTFGIFGRNFTLVDTRPKNKGVLQGSTFGPILYLVFANSLYVTVIIKFVT